MRKFLLLVAFFGAICCVASDRDWKKGVCAAIDVGGYSKTIGTGGNITTVHRRIFTYRIDGGDRLYEGEEDGRSNTKSIRGVEINGPVEYDTDKDHLYLRDSDGKAHKLDLVKTTKK